MLLGLQGEGQWIVPITLSVGTYSNRKSFLLETKVGKLDLSELDHSHYASSQPNENKNQEVAEKLWVKVNVGQTGFYRVKYDSALTARLRKAIEKKCLSPEDKFGMPRFFYLENKLIGALKFSCRVSKMGSLQNRSFLCGSGLVNPEHILSKKFTLLLNI